MKAWLAVLAVAILAMALLPGLSASPAAAQPPGHWEIACVDCPRWFGDLTDHSLRIDAAGHPHMAYGGDHLYYAYHDSSTWHYETADESPGVGSSAALDLDPAGRPYIAYYDSLNQDLKLAFRDGTGWHVTTVDTGGTDGVVGVITRLAVDVDGQPHIVYLDYSQGFLKYAHPGPQGWLVEEFGNPLDLYFYYDFSLSMAVSTAGVPPDSRLPQRHWMDPGDNHSGLRQVLFAGLGWQRSPACCLFQLRPLTDRALDRYILGVRKHRLAMGLPGRLVSDHGRRRLSPHVSNHLGRVRAGMA